MAAQSLFGGGVPSKRNKNSEKGKANDWIMSCDFLLELMAANVNMLN